MDNTIDRQMRPANISKTKSIVLIRIEDHVNGKVLRGLLAQAKLLIQFELLTHKRPSQDPLWQTETSGKYQGQYFTQLFANNYFDLYVWYESDRKSLFGFQLCYNIGVDEHALTWTKTKGYQHNRIDDGETRSSITGYKMAAVLMPDGIFDANSIAQKFLQDLGDVDHKIGFLVYKKLMEYSL